VSLKEAIIKANILIGGVNSFIDNKYYLLDKNIDKFILYKLRKFHFYARVLVIAGFAECFCVDFGSNIVCQ